MLPFAMTVDFKVEGYVVTIGLDAVESRRIVCAADARDLFAIAKLLYVFIIRAR